MATIQTMIRLRDYMSQPLTKIAESTRNAKNALTEYSSQMKSASSSASALSSSVSRLASSFASLYGLSKIVDLADDLSLSASRLDLVLEQMGETSKSVTDYQSQIYAAAQQSRSSYIDMQKSVSKLGLLAGEAFENSGEIATFASQLNKMFVISGAGSREQSMAMYQLTQAMASGRLQGDEYRSIIENAGYLADSIDRYMREVEGATGTMKDWSSQGLLTADVIKNAVAYMQDETNDRFEKMNYTWSQVWQMMKNTAIRVSQPILGIISKIANNWEIIRPIALTVAGALGVLTAAFLILKGAVAINNIFMAISAARAAMSAGATMLQAAALETAAGAQVGLNAAMLACPITWILLGIIAIIGAIYLVVAAYNKATGAAVSATGVIVGCAYAAGAVIYNVFMYVLNLIAGLKAAFDALGYNIVTAFENSIANVKAVFYDLLSTASSVIAEIAEKLNKLPFVNIDVSGLNAAASDYAAKAKAAQSGKGSYKSVTDEFNNAFYNTFDYKNVSSAYNKGYSKGKSIIDNLSGKLDDLEMNQINYDNLGTGSDGTGSQVAKNTAKTADAVTKSSEDLKWLREIAERKAINQFTTAEIKVDMSGMQNNISKELDLDGVVSYLENTLTETMASVAEGNHV